MRVVSAVSVEQAGLGRRPRRWQTRGIGCCVFAVQVGEDRLDHDRIFDTGDDLDVAAAAVADLYGDVEDSFQTLRPLVRMSRCREAHGCA